MSSNMSNTPFEKLRAFKIFKRLFQKSPEVTLFKELEELKKGLNTVLELDFKRLSDEIDKHVESIKTGIKDGEKGERGESIRGERGITGQKGADGKTPTEEELFILTKRVANDKLLFSLVEHFFNENKPALVPLVEQSIDFETLKGKDGKDALELNPQQIADKLNTTEQTVEQNVIEGLVARFRAVEVNTANALTKASQKVEGGGGGGGMGNITKQRFEINSSTTSVTLDTNVASDSNAIWVDYNGQVLAQDTHYTVSGRTVSLLFTPKDGTKITIKYIRA